MIINLIKVIHIFSVISWMAGLLYLPRIFVYHSEKNISKDTSETFKIMERRLYRYIMTPSAILTWVSGFGLSHHFDFELWLIIKILFVISLTIFHMYCGFWVNKFAINQSIHNSSFFRRRNEIPAVILIVILILVVFKPF